MAPLKTPLFRLRPLSRTFPYIPNAMFSHTTRLDLRMESFERDHRLVKKRSHRQISGRPNPQCLYERHKNRGSALFPNEPLIPVQCSRSQSSLAEIESGVVHQKGEDTSRHRGGSGQTWLIGLSQKIYKPACYRAEPYSLPLRRDATMASALSSQGAGNLSG